MVKDFTIRKYQHVVKDLSNIINHVEEYSRNKMILSDNFKKYLSGKCSTEAKYRTKSKEESYIFLKRSVLRKKKHKLWNICWKVHTQLF